MRFLQGCGEEGQSAQAPRGAVRLHLQSPAQQSEMVTASPSTRAQWELVLLVTDVEIS